jgi:O-antigen/teichoic acid export membrane protein
MTTAKRAVRNIISLLISRPLSKVFTFLASIWLVRYLGESLGILDTALSLVALFGYISDLGTQHFVIREISKNRASAAAYLSNFLSLQLIFSIFLFVLIVVLVNVLGYDVPIKQAIYLAAAGLVVTSMATPFKAVFYGHEAIHISALLSIVLALTGGVLTVGGILLGMGVRFFAALPIASGLAIVVLSYFVCKRQFVLPRFGNDLRMGWRMLKMSLPFALLMGATVIHQKIDIQMLYAMKGRVVVSYYSAVTRLVYPLMLPAQAIMTAIYPVLSRRYVDAQNRFRFAAESTLKHVAALAIPMAVGTFLLADKIILLLYGGEFRLSIDVLRILSWTLAISSVNLVITFSVAASGRVLTLAGFNAVAALCNIALNLFLIPRYSIQGAAVATLVCEMLLLVSCILYMRASKVAAFPWFDAGKILLATSIMTGFILLSRPLSVFIVVPMAALLYGGVLLIVRFLKSEEKDLLKSVLQRA